MTQNYFYIGASKCFGHETETAQDNIDKFVALVALDIPVFESIESMVAQARPDSTPATRRIFRVTLTEVEDEGAEVLAAQDF